MPAKVTKVGKGRFKVATPGGVKAKGATLANAKSQQKLLNAIDHGWKPTDNFKKKKKK